MSFCLISLNMLSDKHYGLLEVSKLSLAYRNSHFWRWNIYLEERFLVFVVQAVVLQISEVPHKAE